VEDLKKIDIVIYFDGLVDQANQFNLWIDRLNMINKNYHILIVVRKSEMYEYLVSNLSLNVHYYRFFKDLMHLYSECNAKLILYLNHEINNFQSFIYKNGLHILLHHGYDKGEIAYTNQAKAYDFIFVQSMNEYNNYLKFLINFNEKKLILIDAKIDTFAKTISNMIKYRDSEIKARQDNEKN
jgi:hypothetical protein